MARAVDFAGLVADLEAEQSALDGLVAPLGPAGWAAPTPAAGWDVRDTIGHLATAEDLAHLALTDPDELAARVAAMLADLSATEAAMTAEVRGRTGGEVLAWWRASRARVIAALQRADPRDRVPWVTGPMSAASFTTARLMETWAHGCDVADALGSPIVATARLHHVADLGVRTRPFSYAVHGRDLPVADVAVDLVAPDGSRWTWGGPGPDSIRGPALDFCLVVTQRRHVDDTALVVTGPTAREWMRIAQAFAGPPSTTPKGRGPTANDAPSD